MYPASESNAVGRPVLYAGRFSGLVPDPSPDEDHIVLGDWDVLPGQLAVATKDAGGLVVLDLLSFPFETLTGGAQNVPLILVLPGLDPGFLSAVFGEMVFENLGFFDRVVTPDEKTWQHLRRTYSWSERQRIVLEDYAIESGAAAILGLLKAEGLSGNEAATPGGTRRDKAMYRSQAAALLPQFAAARGARDDDVPLDVLEVGAGDGRWATGFDLRGTRFHGLDASEASVAVARAGFPEADFGRLDPDLVLPYDDETFDLVYGVDVMRPHPVAEKRTLISEMWRVARPGGRLLFLEDFVFGADDRRRDVYPLSVNEFVKLLLQATAWQVVLEHAESVRYPGEDVARGGVIAVSRLGVPRRW